MRGDGRDEDAHRPGPRRGRLGEGGGMRGLRLCKSTSGLTTAVKPEFRLIGCTSERLPQACMARYGCLTSSGHTVHARAEFASAVLGGPQMAHVLVPARLSKNMAYPGVPGSGLRNTALKGFIGPLPDPK